MPLRILSQICALNALSGLGHRQPKLKIRDIRHERDSSVSAYKVVLCYNGLNLNKGLYGKIIDLFSIVEMIVI